MESKVIKGESGNLLLDADPATADHCPVATLTQFAYLPGHPRDVNTLKINEISLWVIFFSTFLFHFLGSFFGVPIFLWIFYGSFRDRQTGRLSRNLHEITSFARGSLCPAVVVSQDDQTNRENANQSGFRIFRSSIKVGIGRPISSRSGPRWSSRKCSC